MKQLLTTLALLIATSMVGQTTWKCMESGNPFDGYKTVAQVVSKQKIVRDPGTDEAPDTLVLKVCWRKGSKHAGLFTNFDAASFHFYFESGDKYYSQGDPLYKDWEYMVPFYSMRGPSDTIKDSALLYEYREEQFLKALKGNGKVYIRVNGGLTYGIIDYEVSLSGSTNALNCALK